MTALDKIFYTQGPGVFEHIFFNVPLILIKNAMACGECVLCYAYISSYFGTENNKRILQAHFFKEKEIERSHSTLPQEQSVMFM